MSGGIYTPGNETAAEKAVAEAESKKALDAELVQELLKEIGKMDPGIRVMAVEAPIEKKQGRIILPDDAESLKKMGCKRFMVLKPSEDVPSKMKNADWQLEAMNAGCEAPMQLDVRKVEFGDFIYAPPFAAVKIPVWTSRRLMTVEVLNWGDIHAIEPKTE